MTEYVFDSSTDLGGQQLGYLEELLDEPTKQFIAAVSARTGQRCLDIGAGSGSITRWLADRTAPGGRVVAVDLDDTHLAVPPDVQVYRHDVNDGLPTAGPFDVIHTRLLLMHLERRREILAELVDALAPGGWLFVGEFTFPRTDVITAPSAADAQLFRRVVETSLNQIGRPAGISYEWGYEVDGEMTAAGLSNVDTVDLNRNTYGGATECLLYSNYVRQVDTPLRATGITADELGRFHELMRDPRQRVWSLPFVRTRGQKPRSGQDT